MSKRVYYAIDKTKIQEAIDLYNEYDLKQNILSHDEATLLWFKYCDTFAAICPKSNLWAANIFQPMKWSGTLDVEHVYYAILAMGVNTCLEEI